MMDAPVFRRFGSRLRDLDVDLYQPALPQMITDILECCLLGPPEWLEEPSRLWDLTVGERVEALLRVAVPGEGAALMVARGCFNPACGQTVEIELMLEELAALQRQALEIEELTLPLDRTVLRVRRPTGRDQLAWQQDTGAGIEQDRAAILSSLIADPYVEPLPAGALEIADELMPDFDPLVSFSLTVVCPYCVAENLWDVDLTGAALDRLRRLQRDLLGDIHRIALSYHWSEGEIFALPAWRRAHYLALLDRERIL